MHGLTACIEFVYSCYTAAEPMHAPGRRPIGRATAAVRRPGRSSFRTPRRRHSPGPGPRSVENVLEARADVSGASGLDVGRDETCAEYKMNLPIAVRLWHGLGPLVQRENQNTPARTESKTSDRDQHPDHHSPARRILTHHPEP